MQLRRTPRTAVVRADRPPQPPARHRLGKCLLLGVEARARPALRELERYTPRTITDHDVLDRRDRQARLAGYSTETEELSLGRSCLAAPLRDRTGRVVAALSLSGPFQRRRPSGREHELSRLVIETADAINSQFGHLGPTSAATIPASRRARARPPEPIMKIRPALTVLTCAVALALSGCNLVGGSPDSGNAADKVTVTVALVPDPPGASQFYRQQFDEFEKANPGIAVKVLENPSDQQLNAVELMFQQNNAPDIFRAQDDGMDRMAARGWVAPLDEFVTPEFLKRFPEGSMEPATSGLHRDGKLMSLPLVWGPWSTLRVFLYNEDLLKKSGFYGPPKTWSELERTATKVTADGKGKYFGYAPTAAKAVGVEMLADTAVPYSVPAPGHRLPHRQAAPPPSPGLVEAVELHRRMQAAKVMMPGWESWDGSRAFKEFAAGQARRCTRRRRGTSPRSASSRPRSRWASPACPCRTRGAAPTCR